MNGKQQTKHLLNLVHRPHLWSTQSLSDSTRRKNFSKALPPPRSGVWKQQWAKPDTEKKSQLAKLWLVQLLAYCDAQTMSKMYGSRISAQWRDTMELVRDMRPFWDSSFLLTLPPELAPKSFIENWLNPPSTNIRWTQINSAWFGSADDLLQATEGLSTINQVEVSDEYGKTLLDAGAYLCKKASSLPEAREVHQLAHLVHVFYQSATGYRNTTGDSELEVAWIGTGGWLNSISDLGQDMSGFTERYTLLKHQPLSHRLCLLYLIADGTNLGTNGEVRFSSEAFRWAYQSGEAGNSATIYDTACVLVPEYSQQWRNAQSLGLSITATIDNTRNMSIQSSPQVLPENLCEF